MEMPDPWPVLIFYYALHDVHDPFQESEMIDRGLLVLGIRIHDFLGQHAKV